MSKHPVTLRLAACMALSAMAFSALPEVAVAASTDTVFELRPICDGEGAVTNVFGGPLPDVKMLYELTDGKCYSYPVRDPESRETDLKKTGDMLEMELVVRNPGNRNISRVRATLQYDPSILEGVSIELSPSFPVPTPGEADFYPAQGIMKIGASASAPQSESTIVVARIRMKLLSTPSSFTPVRFDGIGNDVNGRTAIIISEGSEQNILSPTQGYLAVRLDGFAAGLMSSSGYLPAANDTSSSMMQQQAPQLPVEQTSSAQTTVPVTVASSSAQTASAASSIAMPASTVFTMLQVQNLRASTDGTSLFLAWDALPSSELTSYNVYYGTTSGRYIQRRTVDKGSTTLTIRGLMPGTTYYIAVRGVNGKNQETQFSREVGIMIGNPASSTNPLTGSVTDDGPRGVPPKTGGTVAGKSGPTSALVLFLGISAVIGTALAFRRQFTASTR